MSQKTFKIVNILQIPKCNYWVVQYCLGFFSVCLFSQKTGNEWYSTVLISCLFSQNTCNIKSWGTLTAFMILKSTWTNFEIMLISFYIFSFLFYNKNWFPINFFSFLIDCHFYLYKTILFLAINLLWDTQSNQQKLQSIWLKKNKKLLKK